MKCSDLIIGPCVMILLLCLLPCCRFQEENIHDETMDGLVPADFSMVIRGMSPEVRSILPEETIETRMTQVTLASYDAEGRMIDRRYYEGDLSDMTVYVNARGRNAIYALVNMGDMRTSFPQDEDGVADILWMLDGYDSVMDAGMPMCGKIEDYRYDSGSAVNLCVERLFAKLRIRILHKNIKNPSSEVYAANLCNQSLYLRQANARMSPFAEGGSRASDSDDILDISDYNPDMNDRNAYDGHLPMSSLGPGPGFFQDTTLVFYVPENVQGVLLPENDDPQKKVYDSLTSVDGVFYSDLCTYVELNASRLGTHGYSGSLVYRFFLGEDNTTDFSIRRNNVYDVTLDLTEAGIFLDSWKVSKGSDWNDTRSLYFLEEPYVAYVGETEEVVVHYNRYASSGASSHYPEEWYISYDEELMSDLGLELIEDKSTLTADASGVRNYRMKLTATDDAVEGKTIPISIYSWDGSIADHSVINIARLGEMQASWSYKPSCVSQYGMLEITGVPSDHMPLKVNVSDQSVVSCTAVDDDTFRVVARGVGDTVIEIANSNGTQSVSVPLTVAAPFLWVSSPNPRVNPDGTPTTLEYYYRTPTGDPLDNVDTDTYYELLTPEVIDNGYFALGGEGDELDLYIAKLYVDGTALDINTATALYFRGRGCPEAKSLGYYIGVQNPFSNLKADRHFGSINDYSLIGHSDTDPAISSLFQWEINNGKVYYFEFPKLNASADCVEMGLEPLWTSGFSSDNGVFSLKYDPSCVMSLTGIGMRVNQNDVTGTTSHSAGRHEVRAYVRNRHSGERIGRVAGTMDVYVHTVVAAEASYGCVSGNHARIPDRTFAQLYNEVAGRTVFASDEGYISYMDVSVEYQTPVKGVWLLEKMESSVAISTDAYDALSMLVPSVSHGYVDSFTDHLYSVDGSGGEFMVTGSETVGPRKGIGTVLYRMLRTVQTSSVPTDDQLDMWFFGRDVNNGYVSPSYAPRYDVHDLNAGDDPDDNIVDREDPLYFSPSTMPEYLDSEGRGYHVIHFLEERAPETQGWKYLLE